MAESPATDSADLNELSEVSPEEPLWQALFASTATHSAQKVEPITTLVAVSAALYMMCV